MRAGCVIRPIGWMVGAAAVGAVLLVAGADPAEAARKRKRAYPAYNPPTASMAVDVKTGKILHASNADALRIPASITKVMTLYMLFEQLERGRFSLDSELRVSANASRQAPSKLGLQPGETIRVEDAIKAMVTKSANDVSMVVAENIGGSEDAFAEAMTRKARALGMSRSVFYNPHGLPNDPPNLTTARDLITLGRALQDRFPKYYQYFATRSFEYNGAYYRNHNKLLGRVEGVDGIKTGYTRASGFNLLTSAKADGRHVMAVVLGGRSGRARDAQMAALVDGTIDRAYAGARVAPQVGETVVAASERAEPVRAALADAAQRSSDDSRAAPVTTASIAPPRPVPRPLDLATSRPIIASAATTTPAAAPTRPVAPAPIPLPKAANEAPAPRIAAAYAPVRAGADVLRPPGSIANAPIPAPRPAPVVQAKAAPAPVAPPAAATTTVAKRAAGDGWVIQLGATDNQEKANEVLARAKVKARGVLAKASPFTERISKDGTTLWRARFAGFDSDAAQAACKALKRDGFNCFASRG